MQKRTFFRNNNNNYVDGRKLSQKLSYESKGENNELQ